MSNLSEKELKGLCEAYQVYKMLFDEDKKNIPADFIKKIEMAFNESNKEITIETPLDINEENVSDEGLKYIAYMYLFIDEDKK